MDELETEHQDEYYAILEVLDEGRASTLLIRKHGGFGDRYDEKDDERIAVNKRLEKLTRYGYVRQIIRGMYEITDRGERKLEERDDA